MPESLGKAPRVLPGSHKLQLSASQARTHTQLGGRGFRAARQCSLSPGSAVLGRLPLGSICAAAALNKHWRVLPGTALPRVTGGFSHPFCIAEPIIPRGPRRRWVLA